MLGDNIKKRRLELGYTQEDIVEMNKENKKDSKSKSQSFSVRQLSNWENNSATPSVDNLFDLATILNTTVETLKSNEEKVYDSFIDRFNKIAGSKYDKYDLLIDFLTMGALSYTQPLEMNQEIKERRENHFLDIEKKYTKEEVKEISHLLADLTMIYEQKGDVNDVLGEIILKLDLPEDKKLKFYQEWNASLTMASVNLIDCEKTLESKGFCNVIDPICGVGSTILASAHVLKSKGINYQKELYAEVWDVDIDRVYATIIQLTLYGIPAKIIWGNNLKNEIKEVYYTMMYFYGGWSFRV